jgi:GNAT superfamily N-acetyltransferase
MSTNAPAADELTIRRAGPEDREAIITLARASLGWKEGDPNEAFFAWKHDENAFGTSPAWLSVAPDGRIAGLRVFLRWRFRTPQGQTLSAVRAVDTATHPDFQGRGIFTTLTLGALPDLRDDGIDNVFNTPNDKSRPGYLKMGWSQVGRVPVGVRVTSLAAAPRLARSRTAAEMWSEPSTVGADAAEVLADSDAVARLLASLPVPSGISTDRSPEYLQWRYRFEPLRYRAVLLGNKVEDGLLVVRFRRRGAALECAVCEVLVPKGRSARAAVKHLSKHSGADHLIRCGGLSTAKDGFVPAPQLGPILTWKPVARTGVPALGDLDLSLGDVELF